MEKNKRVYFLADGGIRDGMIERLQPKDQSLWILDSFKENTIYFVKFEDVFETFFEAKNKLISDKRTENILNIFNGLNDIDKRIKGFDGKEPEPLSKMDMVNLKLRCFEICKTNASPFKDADGMYNWLMESK